MFGLVVRFELRPDGGPAFDTLMERTVPAIHAAEPGTLVYVCCRVEGSPLSRIFLELYTDRAAFEAHERTPATMRFLSERIALVASTRVECLDPYAWTIAPPPA